MSHLALAFENIKTFLLLPCMKENLQDRGMNAQQWLIMHSNSSFPTLYLILIAGDINR